MFSKAFIWVMAGKVESRPSRGPGFYFRFRVNLLPHHDTRPYVLMIQAVVRIACTFGGLRSLSRRKA